MHEKQMIITIIVGLLLIGLIKIFTKIVGLNYRQNFTKEYLDKFREFLQEGSFNGQVYSWLTLNVGKIQDELGSNGVIHYYQPAFSNYMYQEYQLIINILPNIRSKVASREEVFACEEALIRHIGIIETYLNKNRKYLLNPIIWLREGIRFIVAFPLYFAHFMGVFQYSRVTKIENSLFFNLITFIITLLGTLSSIMTIALGWEGFKQIIKRWI